MPHPMPEDPEATTFHREMWKPTPLLEGHKAATALGGGAGAPAGLSRAQLLKPPSSIPPIPHN